MRILPQTLFVAATAFSLAAGHADTFKVTTTDSLGAGSLAAAIEAANARPGPDLIAFDIPGNGVQTITVGNNELPEITDPVTIDGYTQPGARANTLAVGDDAVILIRIDGTPASDTPPEMHRGLIISAGDSTVRGLALTGFENVIDFLTGELLFEGSAIILQEGGSNVIKGNFIGFSSDELQNGFNSTGLRISSSNNTAGGTSPAARNVILHNQVGVSIDPGGSGNVAQGNYFGTDPDGSSEMGNGSGLLVNGNTTQIGGRTAETSNLISGNQVGIAFGSSGSENVVEGNVIGADAGGTQDLHNSTAGISISGSDNLIGGLEAGAGSRILFNPVGVEVVERDAGHPAVRNSILSNRIYATASKIELGAGRNDLGDRDTGPNNLQNFPIITSTSFLSDRAVVRGGLNSTPSTTFTLQFFTEYLSSFGSALQATTTVTTDASGVAYFEFDLSPQPFDVIVIATATDPEGNTSEFREDFAVQLANISTRGHVGLGDNLLIGGFVVHGPPEGLAGSFKKKVMLRALGPSLAVGGVGLPGRLANPTLELHDASGAIIAANDNWRSDQEAEITATGLPPKSDVEAALIADLQASEYTVQVRGADGGVGLGVVEVYDLDPLDPVNAAGSGRLVNISSRGLVRPGDGALIGGLIVNGDAGEQVLVRAIGPDLSATLPNALQDPTLEVRDASGTLIAANDDWRTDQEEAIIATGIPPNDDHDAAALCNLIPGAYTAVVRGTGETTGIGLVEIYDLNFDH